jgi:signal transduction histidine kinase
MNMDYSLEIKKDIKILIVEDSETDADLIVRYLKKSGMLFISKVVESRKAFEQALDTFCPDIVLSDYSLPAFDAISAFTLTKEKKLKIPLIIVSGTIGEENAVMLIKQGVTDFASKNNFAALPQKIDRALKEAKELLEKENLLEKLKIQTAELLIANQELEFQNGEKEKRAIELLNVNKELLTFNFISSHDLQEPLRKIQIFISIIMEKEVQNLSDAGKTNIKRIHVAATRMRQLIEDLLNFSKVGITDNHFEKSNINNIIEDVKAELSDIIIEKKAVIQTNRTVMVDIIPFQFRQLIYNLLSNSLKFSAIDVPPRIFIQSNIIQNKDFKQLNIKKKPETCDYWNLSFKDNGIGFEAEFNQNIFTIFQRLHHVDQYSGTGIGLAIVKKIVNNHNGIIIAEGQLNHGAEFNIYIPISQRH